MKKMQLIQRFIPVYFFVALCLLLSAIFFNHAVSVISQNAPVRNRKCIVIDAGHGGVDGGAVSCTGIYESQINLEIALKLNDLCHLLGMNTKMIRTTDCSIYTQGNSIAEKKVSDLKERVRIVNETENAVLISIHQNKFAESQYSGAQVFYAQTNGSDLLAKEIQNAYQQTINIGSNRKIKKSDGVYLMQHVKCPAVLVECGFLSNPEEEAKLRDHSYQQKICCVIAAAYSRYSKTMTHHTA